MSFEDNVLIKLRRQYSVDETVKALSEKIKSLEIENGKLKSEIDYLEYQLKLNNDFENRIAKNKNKEALNKQRKIDLANYRKLKNNGSNNM